ncbi:MAG: glycosyltransferase [Chloroflexota bacterium]|nr:glycosyltransferase [Chloroflexota bacterium]
MADGHVLVRLAFWVCNLAIVYTWAAYPILLKLLVRFAPRHPLKPTTAWPSVSIVLVAHNEEDVIEDALRDLLALEYPEGKLELLVVSDGSTDRTEEIVRACADVKVRLLPMPRAGHTAGVAYGVHAARGDIVVRTDADTRHEHDYLQRLVVHYSDPKVGGVGGQLRFRNEGDTGITRSEGVYWRFEMFLRKAESDLGILSTTSGAVMSFRRSLFEPFSPVYSEDVVIPKLVVKKGYRMVQAPDATAYEVMARSIRGEFRARRRMVARGIAGVLSPEGALSPRHNPGHWLGIVSHKLLRWATPVCLGVSFVGALMLRRQPVYRVAAALHLGLYSAAGIGYWLERQGRHVRLFSAAFSFCLANLGFLVGLIEALRGRRISAYRSQE